MDQVIKLKSGAEQKYTMLTASQALDVSWYMLWTIQKGGSFTFGEWYDMCYAIRETIIAPTLLDA